MYQVLKGVVSKVISSNHTLETSVAIENHSFALIKTMANLCCAMRLHHMILNM